MEVKYYVVESNEGEAGVLRTSRTLPIRVLERASFIYDFTDAVWVKSRNKQKDTPTTLESLPELEYREETLQFANGSEGISIIVGLNVASSGRLFL